MRRLLAQGRDVNFKAEALLDNKENSCNLVFEDNKENAQRSAPQKRVTHGNSLPQSAPAAFTGVMLSRTPNFGTPPLAGPLDKVPVVHSKDTEDPGVVTSHTKLGLEAVAPVPLIEFDFARRVPEQIDLAKTDLVEPLIGQAKYCVGDKVEYYSGTHGQWMGTKVTGLSFDCRGILVSYDLDVKRKALPGKIRWPVLSPSAAAVPVPTKLAASISRTPDWNDLPPEDISEDAARALKPFKAGDSVEYWSSTHSQWMIGRVECVNDDHITYNLDIKSGANRRKMRSCAEDFSGLQSRCVHVIALTSGASP